MTQNKSIMSASAVIIARFQTPYLHEGHKYLLSQIRSKHNKIIIVLGVAPVKGSRVNPFDFYTREKMLKQYDTGLVVLPLKDFASDLVWSQHLDKLLHDAFPNESFILYGSRDSFIAHYQGTLPVESLPGHGSHSASAIREDNADRVLDTEDFRMGINYAYHNTYPKLYPTVDIAVLKDNGTMVLLGKKPHAFQWRFPGGFADPEDETYEAAAKRELKEECGAIEVSEPEYIGSFKIDDWRYHPETDKIMTILFTASFIYGVPVASDDLEFLEWFNLSELETMMQKGLLAAEHHPLFKKLLEHAGDPKNKKH
jgi:bifunctional NMN adenylyltransferase/nudix hydrolase